MVCHFSKSAALGHKQKIYQSFQFLFGVYIIFGESFGIDYDLHWIMQADLQGRRRILSLAREKCFCQKVNFLCIKEELINLQNIIHIF